MSERLVKMTHSFIGKMSERERAHAAIVKALAGDEGHVSCKPFGEPEGYFVRFEIDCWDLDDKEVLAQLDAVDAHYSTYHVKIESGFEYLPDEDLGEQMAIKYQIDYSYVMRVIKSGDHALGRQWAVDLLRRQQPSFD